MTRLIDIIFHAVEFSFVFNYLDDFSDTWEEHVEHLVVLTRLKSVGLTANPAKVVFAREQISFLGHLVGGGGVRIQNVRVLLEMLMLLVM